MGGFSKWEKSIYNQKLWLCYIYNLLSYANIDLINHLIYLTFFTSVEHVFWLLEINKFENCNFYFSNIEIKICLN